MVDSLLVILLFLGLFGPLIAAETSGPPPYYTPYWYSRIASDLGKRLSKDAIVIMYSRVTESVVFRAFENI